MRLRSILGRCEAAQTARGTGRCKMMVVSPGETLCKFHHPLHRTHDGCQRVTVIRIARQSGDMGHELAAFRRWPRGLRR